VAIILQSLLAFDNAGKLKYLHNLVVGILWSMNELVVFVIRLSLRLEDTI
jgi:hypothetical protein